LPKTWRVLEVTQSPTKFGIRMKDDKHPEHDTDLAPTFNSEQDALDAIKEWKTGEIKGTEKKQ
jgi:hypothetical protein